MSKIIEDLEDNLKLHKRRQNYLVQDANERTNFTSSMIRNHAKELQTIADKLWELEQQLRVADNMKKEVEDNYAPPATG